MKKLNCLLVFMIFFFHCIGQSGKFFTIKDSVEKKSKQKTQKDFIRQSPEFYEDEIYIVSKTCSGEWGGAIYFKNKKTGIIHSCGATCAVVVNKIDGKYIITSTLAHMSGFVEIIEIDNPDSMKVLNPPKPTKKKKIEIIGADESQSTKGTIQLLDTMGVLMLASFPLQGQLFHIMTDYRKTYVAKIVNKKFVTIDTVSNISIWTYDPEVIRTINNHLVVFFSNNETSGYLDIFDNKITVVRSK